MKTSTLIPFSGFYNTLHSSKCDDLAQDGDIGEWDEKLSDAIDWEKTHIEYAKEYLILFSKLVGITLTFEEMTSPKEYNFATDRIFALISTEDVDMLKRKIDPEAIRKYVHDHFTSRSGFSSFYSGNYDEWVAQDESFDHNQIGALLTVYAQNIDDEYELNIMYDIDEWSCHVELKKS